MGKKADDGLGTECGPLYQDRVHKEGKIIAAYPLSAAQRKSLSGVTTEMLDDAAGHNASDELKVGDLVSVYGMDGNVYEVVDASAEHSLDLRLVATTGRDTFTRSRCKAVKSLSAREWLPQRSEAAQQTPPSFQNVPNGVNSPDYDRGFDDGRKAENWGPPKHENEEPHRKTMAMLDAMSKEELAATVAKPSEVRRQTIEDVEDACEKLFLGPLRDRPGPHGEGMRDGVWLCLELLRSEQFTRKSER